MTAQSQSNDHRSDEAVTKARHPLGEDEKLTRICYEVSSVRWLVCRPCRLWHTRENISRSVPPTVTGRRDVPPSVSQSRHNKDSARTQRPWVAEQSLLMGMWP